MSDKPMVYAKKIFYQILDGHIDLKKGLELLEKYKRNKVVKGYIFGLKSILTNKKRKYVFDPRSNYNNNYMKDIFSLLKSLGDNRFLGDFEKGFFIAWKDYLLYIHLFNKKSKCYKR